MGERKNGAPGYRVRQFLCWCLSGMLQKIKVLWCQLTLAEDLLMILSGTSNLVEIEITLLFLPQFSTLYQILLLDSCQAFSEIMKWLFFVPSWEDFILKKKKKRALHLLQFYPLFSLVTHSRISLANLFTIVEFIVFFHLIFIFLLSYRAVNCMKVKGKWVESKPRRSRGARQVSRRWGTHGNW